MKGESLAFFTQLSLVELRSVSMQQVKAIMD